MRKSFSFVICLFLQWYHCLFVPIVLLASCSSLRIIIKKKPKYRKGSIALLINRCKYQLNKTGDRIKELKLWHFETYCTRRRSTWGRKRVSFVLWLVYCGSHINEGSVAAVDELLYTRDSFSPSCTVAAIYVGRGRKKVPRLLRLRSLPW